MTTKFVHSASVEDSGSSAGAVQMTKKIGEALVRDYDKNPLSSEERQDVIDHLGASLIALGCPYDKLDDMYAAITELITKATRPVHQPFASGELFAHAAEARRRRQRENESDDRGM